MAGDRQAGPEGALRDTGLALASMTLTLALGVSGVFPPAALLAPLMALLHSRTGLVAVTGGAVLLAYAGLAAPEHPGPATSQRA